jgi:hypothetical protein
MDIRVAEPKGTCECCLERPQEGAVLVRGRGGSREILLLCGCCASEALEIGAPEYKVTCLNCDCEFGVN